MHNIRQKGVVTGVEYTVSWDLKLLYKVLYLIVIANSAVDLCSDHSAQINGSMANTTASRMDQDGLLKV